MTRFKILIFGIALVVISVILFFFFTDIQGLKVDESLPKIIEQKKNERTWINKPLYKFTFPAKLYRPNTKMKVTGDELFVADIGDMNLKRISIIDGTLIDTIGNGRGRGPGEMNNIQSFAIDENDVWLFDHWSRKVHRFTKSGEYIESLIITSPIGTAIYKNELLFINPMKDSLFIRYNTKGEEVGSFGSFISSQTDQPISLSGYFYKHRDQLYYLPINASYIIRFNENLIPTFLQLIDKTSFPTSADAKRPGGRVIAFAPDPDVKLRDLSFEKDTASVLVRLRNDEETIKVIDQYILPNGIYLRSFQIPRNTTSAFVRDGMVYALGDTSISVYEIQL